MTFNKALGEGGANTKNVLNLRFCVAASHDAGELALEVVALDGELVLGQNSHVGEDDQVPGLENSLGIVIVAEGGIVFDLEFKH